MLQQCLKADVSTTQVQLSYQQCQQGSAKLKTDLISLLMMTAEESVLSKRSILRITAVLFFLLKLFSSHI